MLRLPFLLASLAVLLVAAPALAQSRDSTRASPGPLFTRRDALLAAAFLAGAAAVAPLDERLATRLRQPDAQSALFVENAAVAAEVIAAPGAVIIGGALYVVGHAAQSRPLADLGWHGAEAGLVAAAVSALIGRAAGRARPIATDGDGTRFEPGRGFGDRVHTSFPSLDAATAFAAAAAVTAESARLSPRSRWRVSSLLYGGATIVALGEMYHGEHWASDVVAGAAVGTLVGRAVVRYHHTHPGNRMDRLLLSRLVVTPTARGGAVALWTWLPGR